VQDNSKETNVSNLKRQKKAERIEDLNAMVTAAQASTALESWNAFIETLDIPREIAPAIFTGRPELLALMQPRTLDAAECKVMFALISNLIRTNVALRTHAERTAQLVDNWTGAFAALRGVGEDIQRFANFERVDDEQEDD
jgi:hypothetical protein